MSSSRALSRPLNSTGALFGVYYGGFRYAG
jgi:hypothetical protein